ncbi:Arf-GAP with SH3 domain, ANK repeat and PH domain-containing protein [Geosmithia morbida]|uniref:ADP-ribosylation factor GTPase-activating protein n=1 Tax=Geosmithia morbida TaxID=1094350 RepID=A0A9P4YUY4_9HYPO|nr:Arf-GAP with SH3 domain, ANK repeat and PH domain-containing protein [Geosmithia morbida]KAF4123578.1 Arf-GAP with SH3 domain, ANK repeat and PH domain-containing protein [Geosmithia morbida]
MGNVGSRPDDGATLYLRDPNRFTISSLVITSPRKRSSVHVTPNAFPPTSLFASRPNNDSAHVEFVQDPEILAPGSAPGFLLKLNSDDELIFTFTFVIRQAQSAALADLQATDTNISGLTFAYGSTTREVDNLLTREFHADPNLHKNANVELVGDYGTNGSPAVTFEWTWKWKPPRAVEDKTGGWRNSCCFVEYDSRAHRLNALASFSYFVAAPPTILSSPSSPTPFYLAAPPKIRVASSQSVDSRLTGDVIDEPVSPLIGGNELTPFNNLAAPTTSSQEPVKVEVAGPKPGEDVTINDDGPVFRATLKALEQKTGNMRSRMKKVLRKAEQAHIAQTEANDAYSGFMDALREASITNANAVQPAVEHYFDKIAREIVLYERQNTANLQRTIIEPIHKLYQIDIKQAEAKKREFDEDSKDYYSYVSRYLGQRQDSVKAKKLAESDSKYETKRRNFELKRFDYSSFMQDLHGGRKEQEVLSHLTKFADSQTKSFLGTAKKIEVLLPQLEALSSEVQEADKEYQYQRREREEKRRVLEKGGVPHLEPEQASNAILATAATGNGVQPVSSSDSELTREDSTGSRLRNVAPGGGVMSPVEASSTDAMRSPGGLSNSPSQGTKFRGFRDLEERDSTQTHGSQRKEGLLWALGRTSGHVDPRNLGNLSGQGWHKFWIVLDQGKLSEYSNWKQKLDLHMDPIDLRMASVREARNQERRFCFEVITPSSKRVYQATSEEDMNNWIVSINNALQSAMEGRGITGTPRSSKTGSESSFRKDIGSILTGKSHSLSHGHHQHSSSSSGVPVRRITVGARPPAVRTTSSGYDDTPDKLLQMVRNNDQGNTWCADCGSGSKVEWVSINLGIILCIECSGIHRSLGTHISKVRSLTLDIKSFTVDIVELLLLIGNRVSNMVWESKLDQAQKPTAQASREQRLRFITAKYVDRAYVEPISPTLSRYASADETLLAAIKKNEIQQALYALALGANPNVVDKMRGTHAVWLALAAADPASPSPTPTPATGPGGGAEGDSKVVPFPVAELLTQNGAEIPATPPAFPLGRHAQVYVDQKRGKPLVGGSGGSGSGEGGRGGEGAGASESLGSSQQSLGMTVAEKLQRDKESRLAKRMSAGGRLAKSPIPER